MKYLRFDRVALWAASLLLVASTAVGQDFSLAPRAPEDGASICLAPKAQLEYKTPEERGFNAEYKPDVVKHGESECSHPTPIVFSWTQTGTAPGAIVLQLATAENFDGARDYPCGEESKVEVTNLKIGTTYYWRLKSGDYVSEARKFSTQYMLPQWYAVPGISNVRDAGGWKAADGKKYKMGLVFRGTEFDQHHALTEEGKQFILNELGIKVDLDLRGHSEWKDAPDYWSPLGRDVKWINYPLGAYASIFSDEQKKLYRETFKTLADPNNYPMYIHCWGGADRCGTLNMAIKSVLGCSDNDIFTDYEMTTLSTHGNRCIMSGAFQDMLKKFDEYGEKEDPFSVKFVNYLKAIGVTDEELDSIRNTLLEDE